MKSPSFLQSLRRPPRKIFGFLLPLALFLAGWWFGLPPSEKHHHGSSQSAAGEIWTCSMHPQIRQPGPGICPICNMDLIPLTTSAEGGLRELSVSDEAAALLDLRVAPVVRAPAEAELKLFGRIAYDERRITTITSRVSGRLDRLFVDFTGAVVSKGDHLAEIYSPDLLVAQRELIGARSNFANMAAGTSDAVRETRRRLLDAAREKLRLLQFTDEQIQSIEESSTPDDHLTLYAPQAGVVTAKFANEGQYVKTGDPLFKVADLSHVWLRMEAYESDLQWLRYAQKVEFQVEALPGKTFEGRIAFIDPDLDPMRRIAQVRVNVDNPRQELKPGMFAKAIVRAATAANGKVIDPSLAEKWISPMHPEIVKDGPGQCDICGMDLVPAEQLGFLQDSKAAPEPLLVPASAVLRTGDRAVVYVRLTGGEGPTFEGRQIVLGPKVGEQYIVDAGLEEGELVVTRGAFKLDSELQIRAKPSMMNPDAGLNEKPALSAPEALAGQWSPIPRALNRLIENPSIANLDEISELVRGIDGSTLQPDPENLWSEFSRRLINDLQVARDEMPGSPVAAARTAARAIEQAGRYLGLPFEPIAPPPASPQVAAQLKEILNAYHPLMKALAGDDDEAAQKAATALVSSVKNAPVAEAGKLNMMAEAVAAAGDIKSRRAAFNPLSDALIGLIRKRGIDAVGNAYVVHCPMAFKGTGADWLSDKPEVLNPYYGDMMLNCGDVTDTLSVDR
jgi:Cu(I)/Ag(I) efflux system membrane fusion protein